MDDVRAFLGQALGELDSSVEIGMDDLPSASPMGTPPWGSLARIARALVPEARIAPFMSPAMTDARLFLRPGSTEYGFGLSGDRVSFPESHRLVNGDNASTRSRLRPVTVACPGQRPVQLITQWRTPPPSDPILVIEHAPDIKCVVRPEDADRDRVLVDVHAEVRQRALRETGHWPAPFCVWLLPPKGWMIHEIGRVAGRSMMARDGRRDR